MAALYPLFAFMAALPFSWAAALPQLYTMEHGIVGGVPANVGDYPYIVSIQQEGVGHFCGGSLLNANTVITAAHCASASGDGSVAIYIRAGSLNNTYGGVISNVASWIVHPEFYRMDYDLSIIKLSTPIPSCGDISYVKLPTSDYDPEAGSIVSVAGWGTTNSDDGILSNYLRKVDVHVISRETCEADYAVTKENITAQMMCAGEKAGGKDSCEGDSGGPIVDADGVIVGVTSWGWGCAKAGYPGVYSRVSRFLAFIEEHS
ncbi:trypsin [Massarina eburnea CBS 473.64]|uniref:Trypsin n=1 Tax=Massarina eburnea CBS 473.64 TaxID=1395130 RepID=A0A6A6RL33_9PLEO|nr:trypsin [Massarina eburnea CBS 473.64]